MNNPAKYTFRLMIFLILLVIKSNRDDTSWQITRNDSLTTKSFFRAKLFSQLDILSLFLLCFLFGFLSILKLSLSQELKILSLSIIGFKGLFAQVNLSI